MLRVPDRAASRQGARCSRFAVRLQQSVAARQERALTACVVSQAINLVCFWIVGLPLAGAFALKLGMGAAGLWQAMALSSLLQAVVMGAIVGGFDWKRESERAGGRVRQQAGEG